MKICHVFPFFSIRYFGGTSDWMYKLTKAQAKVGMKPVIYCGDYKFDQELAESIPDVEFRVLRSYFDKAGFSIMPELFSVSEQEIGTFDVVHMHVYRTFQNAVLHSYCLKYNVPYVIDAHGAVPYYKRKKNIKKMFDRIWGHKLLNDASAIIAETQVGVDEYLQILPSIDCSRIRIMSAPFDTDEFQSLPQRGRFRKDYGIHPDAKVVMFLGRIHHIKGNDFLIKGVAELLRRGENCQLVIVGGDDGHMKECQQLVASLNITKNVIFTGFLAGDMKLSALVDADVVAQMSRQEQGAWAPIEAVLCGTPIVVTDHTGAGEDVRRLEAGYTVEFDNISNLADTIKFIFDNYDAAKVKTMKAKQHIEKNLSMNARVGEFAALYDDCRKMVR